MRLTNHYSRVALCHGESNPEFSEDDENGRIESKQRWHKGAEYAICTDALEGEQHTKKWERCKEDVLRKHRQGK